MKPLEVGDTVFFACTNPDTGRVKRVAKNGSWATVDWTQNKTTRVPQKHLIPLVPVLNAYLVAKNPSIDSEFLVKDWPSSLGNVVEERKTE